MADMSAKRIKLSLEMEKAEIMAGDDPVAICRTFDYINLQLERANKDSIGEHVLFKPLLTLFRKVALMELDRKSPWLRVLKETMSALIMVTHFNDEICEDGACQTICDIHYMFPKYAVHILESGERTDKHTKIQILCLIGNLMVHDRCSQKLTSNSQLVDRISLAVGNSDYRIGLAALRTVLNMMEWKHSAKPLLMSNIGYNLGNLLHLITDKKGSVRGRGTIITIGIILSRVIILGLGKLVGRQLAASDGLQSLMMLLLKNDDTFVPLIVDLCSLSFELRERLETLGCIQEIVKSSSLRSDHMIKILTLYAQDAWGRVALREKKALDLLIDHLDSGNFRRRGLIVTALREFVHDSVGLAYITRDTKYLDIVVVHINRYLDSKKRICKKFPGEVLDCVANVDKTRHISRFSRLSYATSGADQRLWGRRSLMNLSSHKGNVDIPCASASARFRIRAEGALRSWSPSHSPPPGNVSHSRDVLPCLSRVAKSDDYIHTITFDERLGPRCNISWPPENLPPDDEEQVILGELYLLSWLSHSEIGMQRLMSEKVIDTLLRYIAEAPSMASKAPRAIRRIARNRCAIEHLLTIQFHIRVVHTLQAMSCDSQRAKCSECAMRCNFGAILLDEFALHVDSSFGFGIMRNMYRNDDRLERIKACIATLHLIRNDGNWSRMLLYHQPVKYLLSVVREALENDNLDQELAKTTFAFGPSIMRQIMISFSMLVSSEKLSQCLRSNNDAYFMLVKNDVCKITDLIDGRRSDLIKFECNSEIKEMIPKEILCAESEYFRGMFGNAFIENCTSRDTFQFDEEKERCTFNLFSKFLHLLGGCGRKCVQIDSAEDVASLLELADRYLCAKLSAILLAENGPVKYCTSPSVLPLFMRALMNIGIGTTNVLRDACFTCLLRHCKENEMYDALYVVAGNSSASKTFMILLERFLNEYGQRAIN